VARNSQLIDFDNALGRCFVLAGSLSGLLRDIAACLLKVGMVTLVVVEVVTKFTGLTCCIMISPVVLLGRLTKDFGSKRALAA
jgi:hypothetical protein